MSEVIVLGVDEHGLTELLAEAGVGATRLDGRPVGADLADAGVETAGALVVTDASLASLIAVARERNADIAVVLYAANRLPPFASAQADLSVDPDLVAPAEIVEAIVDRMAPPP